jgi:hypothetical protein
MMRTLQRMVRLLPTRSKLRSCRTHLQRHVADLVEEERAALGEFEAPEPRRHRTGEGALLVAEQFALEQIGGNGTAIDGHEGLAAAAG